MKETAKGLPNTCTRCARKAGPTWWANNDDEAIAGLGVCHECHAAEVAATPPPDVPTETVPASVPDSGTIDRRDGIDEVEATLAATALREHAQPKKRAAGTRSKGGRA